MWFGKGESKRVETIVDTWCGDLQWWITGFGSLDRRLQEEYVSSRKRNESKYIRHLWLLIQQLLKYLVRWEKCNIRRGFIQKHQGISNVCFVEWHSPVQNFGRNTLSVVIQAIFDDTVSISYTCCKFLYNNVIATVYASANLYGFFIYESMYLCGTCDIVHFSIFYRKEQARERKYGSLQWKD